MEIFYTRQVHSIHSFCIETFQIVGMRISVKILNTLLRDCLLLGTSTQKYIEHLTIVQFVCSQMKNDFILIIRHLNYTM